MKLTMYGNVSRNVCLLQCDLPCLPSPGFLGVWPQSSFSTASSLAVLISLETACSTAASLVGSQYCTTSHLRDQTVLGIIQSVSDPARAYLWQGPLHELQSDAMEDNGQWTIPCWQTYVKKAHSQAGYCQVQIVDFAKYSLCNCSTLQSYTCNFRQASGALVTGKQ